MKKFRNIKVLDSAAQKKVKGRWGGRKCRWDEFECEPGICIPRGGHHFCP